jgi:periplasmic divalent cation tolerance protein
MKATSAHVVVTTTCDSAALCKALVDGLLKAKLAACVQVSKVESHYVWKGKREKAAEFLLTIKTRKALLKKVEAKIRALHSYETPQMVAFPLVAGHAPYLKWIDGVTA